MDNPTRIRREQRRRSKGYKMPDNTVYVGRPTKWGNPYYINKYGLAKSLYLYEKRVNKKYIQYKYPSGKVVKFNVKDELVKLKGKNLACFCPLDKPCHADILLKLANQIN